MTVLKLKADGSVEGAASGSDDAGHLDVRSRPSIVGGVGRGGDGYRGDPPMLLSMVKPQILRFKANEIQSHYMSLS